MLWFLVECFGEVLGELNAQCPKQTSWASPMNTRFMDTFLELLSVAPYFLVSVLNKKVCSQHIFVNIFQKCKLNFVKECYGTFVYIWDLKHYFQ